MNMAAVLWERACRVALPVLATAALAACATTDSGQRTSAATRAPVASAEPERLVADAQVALNNFIRDPDQTWVHDNLDRAYAVLIAPQIVKAGFIFGGSGGRAVLVAKDGRSWVGPAFYDLATASVGFQAGVEVSEVVILVMTEKGLNSLMASTFKIGGDASIAAGPVGQVRSRQSLPISVVRARQGHLRWCQPGRHGRARQHRLERRLLQRDQRPAAGHRDAQDRAQREVGPAVDRDDQRGEVTTARHRRAVARRCPPFLGLQRPSGASSLFAGPSAEASPGRGANRTDTRRAT